MRGAAVPVIPLLSFVATMIDRPRMRSTGLTDSSDPIHADLHRTPSIDISAYRALQRAVGLVALLFPAAVVATGHQLRSSLSQYYFTDARDIFVGALCAMGLVLVCYRSGSTPDYSGDRRWSNVGGSCALILAFVPTLDEHKPDASRIDWAMAVLHAASGLTLFISMAALAGCYFVRSDPEVTPQYRNRIRLYRWSAQAIVFGLLAMVLAYFIPGLIGRVMFLVAESMAMCAFACAWLVKSDLRTSLRASVA
jgi:hypothetical protein